MLSKLLKTAKRAFTIVNRPAPAFDPRHVLTSPQVYLSKPLNELTSHQALFLFVSKNITIKDELLDKIKQINLNQTQDSQLLTAAVTLCKLQCRIDYPVQFRKLKDGALIALALFQLQATNSQEWLQKERGTTGALGLEINLKIKDRSLARILKIVSDSKQELSLMILQLLQNKFQVQLTWEILLKLDPLSLQNQQIVHLFYHLTHYISHHRNSPHIQQLTNFAKFNQGLLTNLLKVNFSKELSVQQFVRLWQCGEKEGKGNWKSLQLKLMTSLLNGHFMRQMETQDWASIFIQYARMEISKKQANILFAKYFTDLSSISNTSLLALLEAAVKYARVNEQLLSMVWRASKERLWKESERERASKCWNRVAVLFQN